MSSMGFIRALQGCLRRTRSLPDPGLGPEEQGHKPVLGDARPSVREIRSVIRCPKTITPKLNGFKQFVRFQSLGADGGQPEALS